MRYQEHERIAMVQLT